MAGCSPELKAIKTAIINENEGYNFYLMASERSKSEEVKGIFIYLANEEKEHEKTLRKLYESVANNKLEALEEGLACSPAQKPDIFTLEKLKQEDPSIIASALSLAVKMEKESIDFYREAANKTNIEGVKKIFLQLVDYEAEHLDKLSQAYDTARDEWWAEQGFSPA